MTATRDAAAGAYTVEVAADHPRPMLLHWAVDDWRAPPDAALPPGSVRADEKAVQTPFGADGRVLLRFSSDDAPERVVFVLKETEPEVGVFGRLGARLCFCFCVCLCAVRRVDACARRKPFARAPPPPHITTQSNKQPNT